MKRKQLKHLNTITDNIERKFKFNISNNYEDSSYAPENKEISKNIKRNIFRKFTKKKTKFKTNINKNISSKIISNFNLNQIQRQKTNRIKDKNKQILSENDSSSQNNQNKKLKKFSFQINQQNFIDIMQKMKKIEETKKTQIVGKKKNSIFQKFNFSQPKNNEIILNPIDLSEKEENLNNLFKKINTGKNPDEKFVNEYKNYFIKNKNLSENDLNEFINREYESKDYFDDKSIKNLQ